MKMATYNVEEQRRMDSVDMTDGKKGGTTMVTLTLEEYQYLKAEILRLTVAKVELESHIADLNHDMQATIDDCNAHHVIGREL